MEMHKFKNPDGIDINSKALTKVWQETGGIFAQKTRLRYSSTQFKKQSIEPSSQEEIAQIFNDLCATGTFVKAGQELFNKAHISNAYYNDQKMYVNLNGKKERVNITDSEAQNFLSELDREKSFFCIGDHVINMRKIVDMGFVEKGLFSDDKLTINLLGNTKLSFPMNKSEAKQVIDILLQRKDVEFKDGRAINNDAINISKPSEGGHIIPQKSISPTRSETATSYTTISAIGSDDTIFTLPTVDNV